MISYFATGVLVTTCVFTHRATSLLTTFTTFWVISQGSWPKVLRRSKVLELTSLESR